MSFTDRVRAIIEERLTQLDFPIVRLSSQEISEQFGRPALSLEEFSYKIEFAGSACAYSVWPADDGAGTPAQATIDTINAALERSTAITARQIIAVDIRVEGEISTRVFYAATMARPDPALAAPETVNQAMSKFIREFWTAPQMSKVLRAT